MKMEMFFVLLLVSFSWDAESFSLSSQGLQHHHKECTDVVADMSTNRWNDGRPRQSISNSLFRRRSCCRTEPGGLHSFNTRPTTSTSLAVATPALATLAGAVSGGFFAGGLHAVAGPDHLAALLPRCSGQRWYKAGPVGALWGMGHGIAATLLGASAFALKATFRNNHHSNSLFRSILSGASHVTEIALGLSLIVIGIMGIREAREWEEEITGVAPQSLSAAAADVGTKTSTRGAVILNGLLHGFSWDGAPSLAPSLAVATWGGNLAFLSAYAAGTIATMAIVTTLVGEGTRKAGQFFQRPDIPQKFSLFSSMLAMLIGSVWIGLAVV